MSYLKVSLIFIPVLFVFLFACKDEPTASFTASKISASLNDTILFTNLTTDADHYDWHFGDGTTSEEKNPTHVYNKLGDYAVTLSVYNSDSKRSKPTVQKISIGLAPNCAFTFSPRYPKPGESVHFIDNATNSPSSWVWDFGDGTTSTEKTIDHIFNTEKPYIVKLTVSNEYSSFCQTDSIFVMNQTPIAPVPNFSTVFAPAFVVNFHDESSNNPNKWLWNFGDGNSSTQQNPIHKYSQGGSYSVSFRAFNLAGSNQIIRMINIPNNFPVASFIYSEGANFNISFEDKSSGDPDQWEWNFGDGASSILQNPSHQYAQAGTYTVTLRVSNATGSNQVIQSIFVSNFQYTFFIGNYDVYDEGVGISYTYIDQITATEQTNKFFTGKFGNLENATVYFLANGTTISIPFQTVHCGTPPNDVDHTFNGSGYFIYNNEDVKLFIGYNDVTTLGGSVKHNSRYIKLK